MIDELIKHLPKDNFKTLFEGSKSHVDGATLNKILQYLNSEPNVLNWQGTDHEGSQVDIVLLHMILLLIKRIEELENVLLQKER